jgi:acyl-CoA thioesterase
VLADSTGALRLDDPRRTATLWFPLADVRLDALAEVGEEHDEALGLLTTWSVDGLGGNAANEGAVVARTATAPPAAFAGLAGRVAFDTEAAAVAVEVEDGAPGDDPRDVTVKRFPTWGDAADLVAVMDVAPNEDGSWSSVARAMPDRPVVEGSQMLGQAIVAASRVLPGRRVASAHLAFVRAADARQPLRFVLDEVSTGRSFGSFAVRVEQNGRACAAGTVLLGVPADDVIVHADPMPDVPGPYASAPYDMGVTGRDLRVVDDAYTDDSGAPLGPPELDAWVRFRSVPDDPALHAGLLAQFTGHLSIGAALRAHAGVGEAQAHHTLSTAINAITLSVHADVRVDQWLLYHHRSTSAAGGMTHSECRVYEESGALVASFTVDAMVRAFTGGTVGDARTSL